MYRVSFFSGDKLIACYHYDIRGHAENFIHSFIDLFDPLLGSNLSDLFVLDSDFTICLTECENEVAVGELLYRYVIYKG